MKTIAAPEWTTKQQGRRIVLPQGWRVNVAEVTPDKEAIEHYGRHYRREDSDVGFLEAEHLVRKMVQDTFEAGWMRKLRESILGYARTYATRFPELWQEDGVLLGFDCEVMQDFYFPWHNTGRRGKSWIDVEMGKMAEEASDDE